MRQFAVLLILAVSPLFGQDGSIGGAAATEARPQDLDLSFRFGDTNISDIRDIELFPDGTIAYGGVGTWATIGIAEENGSAPSYQFGGMDLTVSQSVAVNSEDRAVFGGGAPRYDWPVWRVVNRASDFSWTWEGRLAGKASKVLRLPDRDLLVAGTLAVRGETNELFGLVRLDRNGAVDRQFESHGSAGLEVTDAVRLKDGRILGSYRRTNEFGETLYGLGRWESNGARDLTYNNAESSEGYVSVVRHAPSEHLIAAVKEIAANRTKLIPLSASGATAGVNPFENIWIEGEVRALAFETVRPETAARGGYDNILVGGLFTNVAGSACNNLAAISVGGLEWCFAPNEGPDGPIQSVEVQMDGKVLIGGSFTNVSGVETRGMARLAGGSALAQPCLYWADREFRAFEKEGIAELELRRHGGTNESLMVDLAITPADGPSASLADFDNVPSQLLIAAGVTSARLQIALRQDQFREGRERFELQVSVTNANVLITRAAADLILLDDETPGTVDPTFVSAGMRSFQTFGLNREGKVILGGAGASLVRLNPDGSIDPAFVTNGIPTTDLFPTISQIIPRPDGKIYVAGRFNTSTNAAGINHVARLNEDGTLDRSFDPRFYKAGPFGSNDRVFIELLDNGTVVAWTGGGIWREGMSRTGLFWLGENGREVVPSPSPAIRSFAEYVALEHLSDGELFAYTGSFLPRGIKKLRANGLAETNFVALVPLIGDHINDLLVVGDSLFAAGRLSTVNSASVSNLVKLDAISGALDTNFNPAINGSVLALEEHAGKLYISGEFTEVNGRERIRMARLNLDGSLDETFDPGLGPNFAPSKLGFQPDGKILMGTSFDRVDGVGTASLVRLEGDNPFIFGSVPPSVEISWPTNGTEVVLSDAVVPFEVEVKAFDVDGVLESVVVELDGVVVATNSTGGRFVLDRPSAGDHTLTVTATDEDGIQSSQAVQFQVRVIPFPGLLEVRREGEGVTIRYPNGRLQGSSDLRTWVDVHTGGGEFKAGGAEKHRFFRTMF